MSNNPSTTTKSFALRLSNEVVGIIEGRIARNPKRWTKEEGDYKVSDYIKDRIIYDVLRKR